MSEDESGNASMFHDIGICLKTRTIVIDGDETDDNFCITPLSARKDIKNIKILSDLSEDPITVILNCPGGDVLAGMSIYDALKTSRCKIIIKCHLAMSMGSILLQAGDERLLYPNATVMIHNGEVGMHGSPKTVENWTNYNKSIDEIHEDIYLSKIKQKKKRFKREDLQKLLEQDTIFTAQEAVDMGLADEVMETFE